MLPCLASPGRPGVDRGATAWYRAVVEKRISPIIYRPDPALRRRIKDHAARTHRNMGQSITHLLELALDAEDRESRKDE